MGLALRMYVNDYKAYPYYENFQTITAVGNPYTDVESWEIALQPYYSLYWTNPAYHCPAYSGQIHEWDGIWQGSYSYNGWGASPGWNAPSFVGNFGLGLQLVEVVASPTTLTTLPPRSESQVLVPSEMFAMMDSRGGQVGGVYGSPFNPSVTGIDLTACFPTWASPGGLLAAQLQNPPQHGNVFNAASCDGHVEAVRLSELFNPTNIARRWNFDHQPHRELWGYLQ